jgi:hypothetical protein
MAKKKPISKATFVSAAVDIFKGMSIREATNKYQISERDARFLSRNFGLCEEEFRTLVVTKTQVILEEILDRIRTNLDKISPNSLAVTYGILSDKMEKNLPSIHSETLQKKVGLELNGKVLSRAELMEVIERSQTTKVTSYKKAEIIDCRPKEPG